jgi:hypothetical protein
MAKKLRKFVDLTGQKFGLITVINLFGKNKSNVISWNVSCECGILKQMTTGNLLRSSRLKSCGCIKPGRIPPLKLINERVGRLTIISYTPASKKLATRGTFDVICDCGKKKKIEASSIIKRATNSCGCLNDEQRRTVGSNKRKSLPTMRGFKALFASYKTKSKMRDQVFL